MPNYKLKYFTGRGRAEIIRILFEVAGVKYEDVRLEFTGQDWQNLKPKTPHGSLPVLEIDGEQIGQGRAIYRYLAREFGLYGSNNREALDMDIVIELCDDLYVPLVDIFMYEYYDETDQQRLKAMTKKYYNETAPKLFGCLEEILCQNKGGSGFFVGDKVSVADIALLPVVDFIDVATSVEHPDVLAAFPKLKAADKRIRSVDRIADWLKRRPESPF